MKRNTAKSMSTVDPARYADGRNIEDRLIALIDGGEDLADWYTVEGSSRAKKAAPVVDLMSTRARAFDRRTRTMAKLTTIQ